MKYYYKKVAAFVLIVLTLCTIVGCSKQVDTIDPAITTQLTAIGNNYATQVSQLDDETLQSYIAQSEQAGDTVTSAGFASWMDGKAETGDLVSIDSTNIIESTDGYLITMEYSGTNRKGIINMGVNTDMTELTSYTVTPVHSMGEKMTDAALNMMMGMGTVFAVLILISFIISLFKLINAWEKNAKEKTAKKTVDTTTPAPIATSQVDTANQVDDAQLVAVISAAIAAYSGTSSDGLVVRSIKRVSKSNWKKA